MSKKTVILWAVVATAGAAAAYANIGEARPEMKSYALAPGGPMAFETRHGIIITDSAKKARWADERLREAIESFTGNFDVSPGPGVIAEMPYTAYIKAIPEAQRRWTLPWMSRYFGTGKSAGSGQNDHHFDNDSGMRHELNHLFFTATIIPSTKRFQYGGDAPDWLDEAVALTAESPTVKTHRREHFHKQVCAGRLVPLELFLGQQHPLFAAPAMQKLLSGQRAAGDGAPVMTTMSVKQLGLSRNALMDFYAQSNAVAEFLAEESGDPKALRRIALSLKAGTDRPDAQRQRWISDFTRSGDRPLGERFAAWALAAARAGKAGCNAGQSNA
jgi:hypothetical protein